MIQPLNQSELLEQWEIWLNHNRTVTTALKPTSIFPIVKMVSITFKSKKQMV